MQKKQAIFQIKGMSQDLADSKFDSTLAFENFNIRLNPTDDNTLLALCNEKGNKKLTINREESEEALVYEYIIGYSVINKTIVLFSKREYEEAEQADCISTLVQNSSSFDEHILYKGDLGFNTIHPIETLPLYESEDIQKVYWVDGIHQPRVINIKGIIIPNNDTQFDFLPAVELAETVNIERVTTSTGMFPGGTLQYCLTYSKKNGQETKIVYTSNLIYTTFDDRAVGPDETSQASYKLDISNADNNFDYLNIYSIIRTSENGVPIVRLVTRINIDKTLSPSNYSYIDTNTTGEIVDPTFLLYVGGAEFVAQTITSKDNTLFLGNLQTSNNELSSTLKEVLSVLTKDSFGFQPSFYNEFIKSSGYVQYANQLKGNRVTYLKSGNKYRIGIQFQKSTGDWSEPYRIDDLLIPTTARPEIINDGSSADGALALYNPTLTLPTTIINAAIAEGYKRVRPIIVYPEPYERGVIAQGIVCPTVFRPIDRNQNLPYAQASWFFRPFSKDLGKSVEFRTLRKLADNLSPMAEVQFMQDKTVDESVWALKDPVATEDNNSEDFFIDSNISTFHSPDIDDNFSESLLDVNSTNLYIVGALSLDSSYGSYSINTNLLNASGIIDSILDDKVEEPIQNIINSEHILATKTLYQRLFTGSYSHKIATYPWHNTRSLSEYTPSQLTRVTEYSYKIFSNIRSSQNFEYFTSQTANDYKCSDFSDIRLYNNTNDSIIGLNRYDNLKFSFGTLNYKGNDNRLYAPVNSTYQDVYIDSVTPSSRVYTEIDNPNPISIKYRSTKHIVLAFNQENDFSGIPVPSGYNSDVTYSAEWGSSGKKPYWAGTYAYADHLPSKPLPTSISSKSTNKEVMWITELRRNIPSNIFGGDNEYAIKNNKWVPCGQSVKLTSGTTATIYVEEGDTIFNRWDCVKTLPYSNEDKNQIVEIMSFMCESYVNTAGRYDKHRDQLDYTYLDSSVNFNAINPAYNNRNNFFSFRIIDTEDKSNNYPNQITWSLPKVLGEDTDTWTSISLASILEMDGNKGEVRALRRFKNSILSFQDKGIAEVIYNPNAAISTSTGIPIELTNSGKVEGKRYITEDIGCRNKWAISITPNGIYFVDNLNKKAYVISDGIRCISTEFGMDTWFNKNVNVDRIWDATGSGLIMGYDRTVGDVYFVTTGDCLAFNEKLGRFSSKYSYNLCTFFINQEDKCLSVHLDEGSTYESTLWEQHAGEYNKYFDSTEPYYVDVIVNDNPTMDKVFTNVEFRSDSWVFQNNKWNLLDDETFDKLTVYNEYQTGISTLSFNKDVPSTLKRKFRIWRANVPRNNTSNNYSRDRIRNTWANVKLEKSNPSTEKTILHDIVVDYLV